MCFILLISVLIAIGFVLEPRDRWPLFGNPRITPTNNRAFDEYHAETLRRLEDDRREFVKFIDGLHFAKDKAVFDQFTTARVTAKEL